MELEPGPLLTLVPGDALRKQSRATEGQRAGAVAAPWCDAGSRRGAAAAGACGF